MNSRRESPTPSPTAFDPRKFFRQTPTLSPAAPSSSGLAARTFSTDALTALDHGRSGDEDKHRGREAELEGAIVSIDAAAKTFVVRTTTVNVLETTIIRHGRTTLAFADLKAGDQVHVKGAANGAAIDAREIKVQHEDRDDDAGERARHDADDDED